MQSLYIHIYTYIHVYTFTAIRQQVCLRWTPKHLILMNSFHLTCVPKTTIRFSREKCKTKYEFQIIKRSFVRWKVKFETLSWNGQPRFSGVLRIADHASTNYIFFCKKLNFCFCTKSRINPKTFSKKF